MYRDVVCFGWWVGFGVFCVDFLQFADFVGLVLAFSRFCVISTPVILNGGEFYKIRPRCVCVCVCVVPRCVCRAPLCVSCPVVCVVPTILVSIDS